MNKTNSLLEIYRVDVKFLAEKHIDWEFNNSSPKHGAIVLANILNTCNEVCIFDTDLSGDVAYKHDDFLNAIERFSYGHNKKLKIAIKNNQNGGMLYKKIRELNASNIEIRKVDDFNLIYRFSKENSSGEFNNVNFAVGDNRAFRIEFYNKNPKYKAKCNFNSPEKTTKLKEIFMNLYNKGQKIT